MKTIKILFFLNVLFASQILFAQTKNIEGNWLTANKKSVIRIETDDSGKSHYGKVAWIDKSVDRDKAGDALGKVMVKNLAAKGDVNKYKGQVFIPRINHFRDAEFELQEDKLLITMKIGFSSRMVEWTRQTENKE